MCACVRACASCFSAYTRVIAYVRTREYVRVIVRTLQYACVRECVRMY